MTPTRARVWHLTGGDLNDPVVAEAYCHEIVPRVSAMPGYLGVLVVVDHERSLLRGVSFWSGEDAEHQSQEFGTRASEAVSSLASADVGGFRVYDVVVCRFHGPLARRPEMSEVDHLLVRIGMLEADSSLDLAAIDALEDHVVHRIDPTPGCVGTLLLRDRVQPGIFGVSIWDDAEAASRTDDTSGEVFRRAATAMRASSSDQGSYSVVVNQPMATALD